MEKELEELMKKALRMEPVYDVDLEEELISTERVMYIDKNIELERIDGEEK